MCPRRTRAMLGATEFGDGAGPHTQHDPHQQLPSQQYHQQGQRQGQQPGSQGAGLRHGHGHGTVLHFPVPPGIEFWKARQSPLCAFKVRPCSDTPSPPLLMDLALVAVCHWARSITVKFMPVSLSLYGPGLVWPCQRLQIVEKGRMEDEGLGCLQVDFANAFLGGGRWATAVCR